MFLVSNTVNWILLIKIHISHSLSSSFKQVPDFDIFYFARCILGIQLLCSTCAFLQNGLFSSLNCLLSLGFSFLLRSHTFSVCLDQPLGLMCSFTLAFFISTKRLDLFFVTTACYMKKHPYYLALGIK